MTQVAADVQLLENRMLLSANPLIGGEYQFNGLSTSVEQNGDRLTFINEHGARSAGIFLSPTQVQASDWGNLVGTLIEGDIEWQNGTTWEERTPATEHPNIAGDYSFNGRMTHVNQNGSVLTFINENAQSSAGEFLSSTEIAATDWGNLVGTISEGNINWTNGSIWVKPSDQLPDISGDYTLKGQTTRIEQSGSSLTFINENGHSSAGAFLSSTQVVATGWGNLVGTISDGNINWANGSDWVKATPPPVEIPDIAGDYTFNGQSTRVEQSGASLTFLNENGGSSAGTFLSETEVIATNWGGLRGTLVGRSITWANGTTWDVAISVEVVNGTLSITGTDADDEITVRQLDGQIMVDGVSASFSANDVTQIVVNPTGGNDQLYVFGDAHGHATPSVVVGEGQAATVIAPHHADSGHPANPSTHFFAETGDAHHFAWNDANPATPSVIDIWYDYRNEGGFANLITGAQMQRAEDAMRAWERGTRGKIQFVRNTTAPLASIINIGTGDLAALGDTSGPGRTLGLGGGRFTHNQHTITRGRVWMDFAETWDTTIGNGNPTGTVDYFTVVAQEIGHALGLGHTDDLTGPNIMDGSYAGEQTALSANDVEHIRSVYGVQTWGTSFTLQTGTALHETGSSFDFQVASNGDLFAIKKSATGTGRTEIHVLSAASGYQAFSLQTGTALHETDSTWDFVLAPNRDLFAIKKSGTGTGRTEIHVLSAASGYQTFSLQIGTGLHQTDSTWEFALAANHDLLGIKKSGTGTNSTEIHVLSAASGYQAFSLQTGTALHETDGSWEFALRAPYSPFFSSRDLFAIKKSGTGTNSTEVHVLSAASGYQSFSRQTGTVLHETGLNFAFGITFDGDLFSIKKSSTGTNSTEVHIIDLS